MLRWRQLRPVGCGRMLRPSAEGPVYWQSTQVTMSVSLDKISRCHSQLDGPARLFGPHGANAGNVTEPARPFAGNLPAATAAGRGCRRRRGVAPDRLAETEPAWRSWAPVSAATVSAITTATETLNALHLCTALTLCPTVFLPSIELPQNERYVV